MKKISEKMCNKIAFWLAIITTEVVMYLIILAGISIMFRSIYNVIYLPPIVILGTIIEAFSVWRRYMLGTYTESYRKHVCKEAG